MSHFTVLIKVPPGLLADHDGNVESAIGEMLDPYNENNEGEPHREHENPRGMKAMVEHYKAPIVKDEKWTEEQIGQLIDDHYVLAAGEAITKKELVALLEENGQDWQGNPMGLDENGEVYYVSRYNPLSKWDWYSIGGRWQGLIPIKEGAEQLMGEPGVGVRMALMRGEPVPEAPKHVSDIAKVKDFDFERMDADAAESCREAWEKFLVVRECVDKEHSQLNATERELMQPFGFMSTLFDLGIADREKVGEDEKGRPEWGAIKLKEIPDFEAFKKAYGSRGAFSTWAVLDKDGWHEKGQMGWFGMGGGTAEEHKEFEGGYVERFLRNEDPETTLVVVDCHI